MIMRSNLLLIRACQINKIKKQKKTIEKEVRFERNFP